MFDMWGVYVNGTMVNDAVCDLLLHSCKKWVECKKWKLD